MIKDKKLNIKNFVDNILLINLFLVILSAIFFLFSLVLEINGNSFLLNFFRKLWEPFILPIITILITSSILNGIISWLIQKARLEDKDI